MTNQIFYWKQLTSPADLPKEEGCYLVETKMGVRRYLPFDMELKGDKKWFLQHVTAYLCPLTVDNIPEWVEEEAVKYALAKGWHNAPDDMGAGWCRADFKAGAKLLLPLINQGKGETESKFDPFVQKHMNIFWEKLKEANIERFIKPMFGSLSSASISYFLETGRVNGGFLEALNKMMDVVWRLSKLHGEQNPDECDARNDAHGDTADLQKQISELKSELEEAIKDLDGMTKQKDDWYNKWYELNEATKIPFTQNR